MIALLYSFTCECECAFVTPWVVAAGDVCWILLGACAANKKVQWSTRGRG